MQKENETLRLLESRKSMRVFENRPVPEDVKQKLLSVSLRAASAGNMALYTII
ncbi:MAG TPA: nitroreductase family protein, partial [Candidatus Eisenbergiella stercorigallinarum]|nr:nitroreductase family protein [Candidatus Eisenbergiella stercorigallinarum]